MRLVSANGKTALAFTYSELEATGRKYAADSAADDSEFLPISCPTWGSDAKMFIEVWNQGIDASLQAFTKSKHSVVDGRLNLEFHKSELPILVRRLRALETEEAESWADNIEPYIPIGASDQDAVTSAERRDLAERLSGWSGGMDSYVRGLSDSWLMGKDDRDAAYVQKAIAELQSIIQRQVPHPEAVKDADIAELKQLQTQMRNLSSPEPHENH